MAKGTNRQRTKIASQLLTADVAEYDYAERRGVWLDSHVFMHLSFFETPEEEAMRLAAEDQAMYDAWEAEREAYSSSLWDDECPCCRDQQYDNDLYAQWNDRTPVYHLNGYDTVLFNTELWHVRRSYNTMGTIMRTDFEWVVTYIPHAPGGEQAEFRFPLLESSVEAATQLIYMLATLEGDIRDEYV
jgi:hypothetical protein